MTEAGQKQEPLVATLFEEVGCNACYPSSGLNITVGHQSKTAHLRTMTGCLHSWSDIVSGQCKINTSG